MMMDELKRAEALAEKRGAPKHKPKTDVLPFALVGAVVAETIVLIAAPGNAGLGVLIVLVLACCGALHLRGENERRRRMVDEELAALRSPGPAPWIRDTPSGQQERAPTRHHEPTHGGHPTPPQGLTPRKAAMWMAFDRIRQDKSHPEEGRRNAARMMRLIEAPLRKR